MFAISTLSRHTFILCHCWGRPSCYAPTRIAHVHALLCRPVCGRGGVDVPQMASPRPKTRCWAWSIKCSMVDRGEWGIWAHAVRAWAPVMLLARQCLDPGDHGER